MFKTGGKIRYIVCVMLLGISGSVWAQEPVSGPEAELNALQGRYLACRKESDLSPRDSASLNEAAYREADCYQAVGRDLIQTFFSHNEQSVLDTFNRSVELIYKRHHDWMQNSDYGRATRTGSLYNTQAIDRAVSEIAVLVKGYFTAIRAEITDAGSDEAWRQAIMSQASFEQNERLGIEEKD